MGDQSLVSSFNSSLSFKNFGAQKDNPAVGPSSASIFGFRKSQKNVNHMAEAQNLKFFKVQEELERTIKDLREEKR